MTFELKPCPKPTPEPRTHRGMKRVRMKCRNEKRGGSVFPHKRDAEYRRWIRSMGCLIWGAALPRQISLNDEPTGRGFAHRCWGPMDPAHVGQHQATGAPDRGAVVCLCRAAHKWYDEHRPQFAKVTGLTDKKLENIAAGLGLKYSEQGR